MFVSQIVCSTAISLLDKQFVGLTRCQDVLSRALLFQEERWANVQKWQIEQAQDQILPSFLLHLIHSLCNSRYPLVVIFPHLNYSDSSCAASFSPAHRQTGFFATLSSFLGQHGCCEWSYFNWINVLSINTNMRVANCSASSSVQQRWLQSSQRHTQLWSNPSECECAVLSTAGSCCSGRWLKDPLHCGCQGYVRRMDLRMT